MDKTGLNYRLLPIESYVHNSASGVRGIAKIKSSDRVTLYIAINSTGTHKLPLEMIGNSKNPRCLGQDNRKAKIVCTRAHVTLARSIL